VILWGFMTSGKSTVGAELARRQQWQHLDLDHEIEQRQGRSVSTIFAEEGEPYFRRLEVETTRDVIGRSGLVLSTGGGWVTNPESFSLIPQRSLTVWLRVSSATALARATSDGGGLSRPLLAGTNPAESIRRLLAAREPLYNRADLAVSTDGRAIGDIVSEIESHMAAEPGPRSVRNAKTDHAEG
jgi:shikimate kinase